MECNSNNYGSNQCQSCSANTTKKEVSKLGIEKIKTNELNSIKYVLAIMSGKGGVGKSSVTALLASELARNGNKVGILDADVTGPSIPKIFGIKERPKVIQGGLYPVSTNTGIKIMSVNLLLEKEEDPVIWRGPLIAGAVRQFWADVIWGELDYLLVDLPPGTGDSPLTVMQSLPVNGIVVVSSPQELAHMVVNKAINMVEKLNVPICGMIENMSYMICPHCGEPIEMFGSRNKEVSYEGVPKLGEIPLDPTLSRMCDEGVVEFYTNKNVTEIVNLITNEFDKTSH